MRISGVQFAMLLASDWERVAARWQELLQLLARRPPAFVARLERERLQRVRGGA
jgi:hypothetical protein